MWGALSSVNVSSCVLGTDQWVWAGIQHAKKLRMGGNSANCQNPAWTAELMVAMQRGSGYWLEFVTCEWANELEKRQIKLMKNQLSKSWGCWRFNVKKDLQKLRFKDSYRYCCDKNRQLEDNELFGDNTCGTGRWALADVSWQWPGKHGVI